MKADGEKIHALVEENRELFRAEKDSEIWKKYIEYLDDIVLDGFFNCVQCSLQYLLDNTDKNCPDMPPLIQAKLELQVGRNTVNNYLMCTFHFADFFHFADCGPIIHGLVIHKHGQTEM